MAVMNFDLEDGLPPVSFDLKPYDAERFAAFMSECHAALAAAPTPAWPRECEELCKAAEQFQQVVNELWKAENPDELQDGDTAMDEEEARELRSESWKALESAIYYMRKRMSASPAPTPPVQPAAIDFGRPLETHDGEPVRWITSDVIEYKCARVCVDERTGVVYSS